MCCSSLVGLQSTKAMVAEAYLVKGQHLANQLPAILHGDAHLVVDLGLL